MIVIKDELLVRLEARLQKLWKTYGKKGSQIASVEELANNYLQKQLERVENKDKQNETQKQNLGITWVEFRRKHFDEIYKRDNGQCQYCQKYLSRDEATIDHILAPLRGGQNTLRNVQLCCEWCNVDKGILTENEYHYKQLVNKAHGIEPNK